jgi:hypothetical protein
MSPVQDAYAYQLLPTVPMQRECPKACSAPPQPIAHAAGVSEGPNVYKANAKKAPKPIVAIKIPDL